VLVRRVIATADVTATQTDAQVQPDAALSEAVLAAFDAGGQLGDGYLIEMGAAGHGALLFAPGYDDREAAQYAFVRSFSAVAATVSDSEE
jgi:hypothetical protein